MTGGNTGRAALSVCICVLMAGVLGEPADGVEATPTVAAEKHIRQSHSLSAGEEEYIQKRKQLVRESLNSLGINCSEDSVPHIALLPSGGGQRSAVALLGFLYQMEEHHLLDTLLYLGGVSGSTWSMSALYSDPLWSTNMATAVSRLSGTGVGLDEAMAWLDERAVEDTFSLADIWAVITSAGIMKQFDRRRLSDEASRNVTNPYPVYSAIEKHCFSQGPIKGKWFEVTPHEAGFPELGLFVETPYLGSKFQAGEVIEKTPEMDMVKLQGILGCALADEETAKLWLPVWLNVSSHVDGAVDQYLLVYHTLGKLIAFLRNAAKDTITSAELDKLEKLLEDKLNRDKPDLLESMSSEERNLVFQHLTAELLETWSQNMEEGSFNKHASWLAKQIVPLLLKWEWGTTRNFLYQYPDSSVPPCLGTRDRFHLIDAGLLINAPYPSFLGDKRDIDLIIAPEYSAGDIFETLTLTRDYATAVNKPFPKIGPKILEEKDWPKDCYVFQGKQNRPTIIYMPLFNRRNCKDAEEVTRRMEEFSTFQLPFNQEKNDFLLETAKANMRNNKEIIVREIRKAAERRQSKRSSSGSDL